MLLKNAETFKKRNRKNHVSKIASSNHPFFLINCIYVVLFIVNKVLEWISEKNILFPKKLLTGFYYKNIIWKRDFFCFFF